MKREVWSAHARADLTASLSLSRGAVPPRQSVCPKPFSMRPLDCASPTPGASVVSKGTFEQVVRRQPYIILFEMTDEEVRIMRVVHTARDWPEGQMPPP